MITTSALPAQLACRVLQVSESGFYAWRSRAPSARAVRYAWLTDLIRQVHSASRGTYGIRRVHADLTLGQSVAIGHQAVELLMRRAGIHGISGRPRYRHIPGMATASDHVDRQFHRADLDQLWVTDITEHPTREGKLYCCVVLDAYSRSVVGWSIDSQQAASLVMSALGMAIANRKPKDGAVVHSDHGSQFTSWAFSDRVKSAGLALSMGRVGDAFDNAMMEAFWGRMQTELLNRRRWRTRLELANAIFEYLEIFHNRKRRHSALGMLTPHEYETLYHQNLAA